MTNTKLYTVVLDHAGGTYIGQESAASASKADFQPDSESASSVLPNMFLSSRPGTSPSKPRNKDLPEVFLPLYDGNEKPTPQPTQLSSGPSYFHESTEGNPRRFRNAERDRDMKLNYKTWIGMLLLAGSLLASAPAAFSQVSIGIQIGAPPAPRVIAVRPPCPEPEDDEFVWIDGYWYPTNGHYYWHRGYWTRPPYVGAVWVVPHYEEGRYYVGYWRGPRGRFDHNHHWDHDGDRDRGRWHQDNGKHKGWYKKDRDDDDRD